MSFWDNVKKFAQPYSDDEYDEYEEENEEFEEEKQPAPRTRHTSPFASANQNTETAPAASSGFNGQVLNMSSSGKQEVVLFHAKTFDDAAKAADELRRRKVIILNMENVDKTLTRRVVDFLSGSIYALDGSVKKIAQSTYLFCPHNMDVIGDLESIQVEADSMI
jgi:cell division inhibitor SepF